jgi:hypothetical protein
MVSMTSQLSHYHTLLVFLSERDLEMKSPVYDTAYSFQQ